MAQDSLADLLAAAKEDQRRPTGCAISHLLDTLEDEDAKALISAFEDPAIHSTSILKALKARDIQVSERTVQRHRKGTCACG